MSILFMISLKLDIVLGKDQCTPNRQTFSLVQDNRGTNLCAPYSNKSIVTFVGSRAECGGRCMKTRQCTSYTFFDDTMRCVIYTNNPPPYFEYTVPNCWSYVVRFFIIVAVAFQFCEFTALSVVK